MKRRLPTECDVFLHVVGDAFHLFLQLRHRLHQVVRVVAPQVVEYDWYWVSLRVNLQFLVAFGVCGSAKPASYVAMVLYCVSEVFLK